MPKRLRLILATALGIVLPLMGAAASLSAAITVEAATVIRQRPPEIGGVVINAHTNEFATGAGGIDFQADLKAAGVRLVRNATYPDGRRPDHDLAYFDANVAAIIAAGAQPLLIQYLRADLPFLTTDGRPGGDIASNVVFLVRHYLAAPFRLERIRLEVGNEPDIGIDHQCQPDEYCAIFNRVHAALTAAGLREQVVLCGPVIAFSYRWPKPEAANAQIMDRMLELCRDSVDIVTYHDYSGAKDAFGVLNAPHKLVNMENSERTIGTADYGVAALLQRMDRIAFGRPHVGIGLTEHNTTSNHNEITQGLWQLAVTQFYSYNPRGAMTTAFVYDCIGNQQGGDGHYDEHKQKNFAWWALWMDHHLRGPTVLKRSVVANGSQLAPFVGATRDQGTLFVEVINRDPAPVTDTIHISGINVHGGVVHVMAAGRTPDHATPLTGLQGGDFTATFPSLSATVFALDIER